MLFLGHAHIIVLIITFDLNSYLLRNCGNIYIAQETFCTDK